ncbi:MAG: cytidylate kinase-like family protein [Treponema sp.]|nr:cytidylate kinase-like family protein [Spirochaetia bacterium]MDD7458628.1 cytidylate kinase-like family protein [Spirochaetales bacterium]MDY5812824.1 cytidylate kinase-like family protein [Treponema sp.]
MSNNYVITIARGFGSGGKEIAAKLGEKLGIPVYEKQILEMASEYSGLSEEMFLRVDEKLRGNSILNALSKFTFPKNVTPQSKRFECDINLFCIQSEIIKELARNVSCIILGKCADHVLKDFDNVGSFYVEAPRAACLDSIMKKMGVSEKEAADLITKTDKYRADYYRFYSGGNYWTNPVNYDLTLNSARIGRDKCVDVIIEMMKIKFGEDFVKAFEGKI